jgi:hypothetical protein
MKGQAVGAVQEIQAFARMLECVGKNLRSWFRGTLMQKVPIIHKRGMSWPVSSPSNSYAEKEDDMEPNCSPSGTKSQSRCKYLL